ncbi:unnamed protein product [Parajaminaea phylloscopi]
MLRSGLAATTATTTRHTALTRTTSQALLLPRSAMSTGRTNGNPLAKSSRVGTIADRITAEYNKGADVWSTFNSVLFPDCVNLGQGFMNWSPPAFIRDAMRDFAEQRVDVHHYSHPKGRPRLRQAVANSMSASFRKPAQGGEDQWAPSSSSSSSSSLPKQRPDTRTQLDAETEVQITAGANAAIYCAMTAFLEPGDEVIFLSPHFDQYECEVTFMGGKPVYVPLLPPPASAGTHKSSDWKVDWDALEAAMARPSCKAILFNTPHNPLGKVFDADELARLASMCIRHDLLVVADEVYDILTFDDKPHLRIASFEGMWNRTVTVGSAGKSFAATGWRIGWAVGPAHLVKPILVASTRITFSTNSIAAEASAVGLEEAPKRDFYAQQIREYQQRRSELCRAFDQLGLPYTLPEGAYFVIVDFASLEIPQGYPFPADLQPHYRMSYFVAKEAKVLTIPVTAFVSDEHVPRFETWLRFSFAKDLGGGEEGGGELQEGGRRLQSLAKYIRTPAPAPAQQG